MASQSQHQQEASAGSRGGRQAVVELQRVTRSGIVLWSRQRFEIGVQLQIRVAAGSLPEKLRQSLAGQAGPWVVVTGYVVECPPVRRQDGASGFQVSVLLDGFETPFAAAQEMTVKPGKLVRWKSRLDRHASFGLN